MSDGSQICYTACSNNTKKQTKFQAAVSLEVWPLSWWVSNVHLTSSNQANCSYCFSELCPGTLEWSGQCQWNHAPENHTATNCHWLGLQYLLEDTSTLLMKPCPTTCTHFRSKFKCTQLAPTQVESPKPSTNPHSNNIRGSSGPHHQSV